MGECWYCGRQVLLKDEEVRCDNCQKVVRYWCWSCKTPFDVQKENKDKTKECGVCGFFICPSCGECGENCDKKEWYKKIREILAPEVNHSNTPNFSEKLEKIGRVIEDIKITKEQKKCEFGVPMSYANHRVKILLARAKEKYAMKNELDYQRFKKELEKIEQMPHLQERTVNQLREEGTYGQETRDALNAAVCMGLMEVFEVDDEKTKRKFSVWRRRCDKEQCPHLNTNNLVVTYCRKCKKSDFDKTQEYCTRCYYQKDIRKNGELIHNKGDPFPLYKKLSDVSTCNLKRMYFKKRDKIGVTTDI